LTRLAENAVEHGVNEITNGEMSRDTDFKVKRAPNAHDLQQSHKKKNAVRKKKKSERQNRKTNRK
jgi:hypothetical protein